MEIRRQLLRAVMRQGSGRLPISPDVEPLIGPSCFAGRGLCDRIGRRLAFRVPDGLHRRAEDRGRREEKRHLDLENQEQKRHDIEPQIELERSPARWPARRTRRFPISAATARTDARTALEQGRPAKKTIPTVGETAPGRQLIFRRRRHHDKRVCLPWTRISKERWLF